MKKLIAAILLLTMILCLCACGEDPKPTENKTEPNTTTAVLTTIPTTTVSDGKVTYTVSIVDDFDKPVAGAMIQLCKDACVPGRTNDLGVAEFRLAEDTYKVSFLAMPEGYSYADETTEFYFESGATELTIRLKKVN